MSDQKRTLIIDDKLVEFSEGQTILDVARDNGIYIPTLCYIDGLPPYGGCRLCMVNVEGMKGYPTACSTPAQKDMKIMTNNEELQNLRRELMNLILSEHPYSCLVCDSRDICEEFRTSKNKSGRTFGCFSCSNKEDCEIRLITDHLGIKNFRYDSEYKNLPLKREDPFFEQDYNLCILCGKCVRICSELRGIGAINFINRGPETRVSTAFDLLHLDTNCQFCGACVDVCPTGVLTAKNTKWVLRSNNFVTSICGFCSVGCGFDYYSNNEKLVESIPNKENITNKGQACVIGRFCAPPFTNGKERLRDPLIKKENNLIPCGWDEAHTIIRENLLKFKPEEIAVLASSDLSNESAYILNKFSSRILKTNNVSTVSDEDMIAIFYNLLKKLVGETSLTRSFQDIGNSKWILLINANIQITHPVLMINLKRAKDHGVKILSLNIEDTPLPFETRSLLDYEFNLPKERITSFLLLLIKNLLQNGESQRKTIKNLAEFHSWLEKIKISNHPTEFKDIIDLIIGNKPGTVLLGHSRNLSKTYLEDLIGILLDLVVLSDNQIGIIPLWERGNTEGVFQNFSYTPDSRETIFKKIKERKIKALYLTERIEDLSLLENIEFLILHDIYPSDNFQYANVVLPACTFIEDSGSLINSELRIQKFKKSASGFGKSRPDWDIFCELATKYGGLNAGEFQFSNTDEVFNEFEKQVLKNKAGLSSRSKKSLKNLIMYIPTLKETKLTPIEDPLTLDYFKYRGERISNQVSDLRQLVEYRTLEKSAPKLKPQREKAQKLGFNLLSNAEIAPNMYKMVIEAPLIAKKARPGNFIIIMKNEESERIPLTISDWDAQKGIITIYYQERGFSTKELTELVENDCLYSVVGPLGNEIKIKKFGTILLGGGCYGIGAIYPIAKEAKSVGNKVIVILEARNKELFFLEKELEEVADKVIYCTSDGSKGFKGKIDTCLEHVLKQDMKIDLCFFIGCKLMMKAASDITKKEGKIPTYVSLNTIMIDGTGMCGGCRLSLIQEGEEITKFACVDGPTFDGHLVNWEEMIGRGARFDESEVIVYQNQSCKAVEKYNSENSKSSEY